MKEYFLKWAEAVKIMRADGENGSLVAPTSTSGQANSFITVDGKQLSVVGPSQTATPRQQLSFLKLWTDKLKAMEAGNVTEPTNSGPSVVTVDGETLAVLTPTSTSSGTSLVTVDGNLLAIVTPTDPVSITTTSMEKSMESGDITNAAESGPSVVTSDAETLAFLTPTDPGVSLVTFGPNVAAVGTPKITPRDSVSVTTTSEEPFLQSASTVSSVSSSQTLDSSLVRRQGKFSPFENPNPLQKTGLDMVAKILADNKGKVFVIKLVRAAMKEVRSGITSIQDALRHVQELALRAKTAVGKAFMRKALDDMAVNELTASEIDELEALHYWENGPENGPIIEDPDWSPYEPWRGDESPGSGASSEAGTGPEDPLDLAANEAAEALDSMSSEDMSAMTDFIPTNPIEGCLVCAQLDAELSAAAQAAGGAATEAAVDGAAAGAGAAEGSASFVSMEGSEAVVGPLAESALQEAAAGIGASVAGESIGQGLAIGVGEGAGEGIGMAVAGGELAVTEATIMGAEGAALAPMQIVPVVGQIAAAAVLFVTVSSQCAVTCRFLRLC